MLTTIEIQDPNPTLINSLTNPDFEEHIQHQHESANGQTHYVGGSGPGNHTTIQNAINHSENGDIIYVYNGNYTEKIIINKSISLLGENRYDTTIIGEFIESANDNIVITVLADNVYISGFNITGAGGYYHDDFLRTCSGITIDHHTDCTIIDNYLHDLGDYGIRLRQSHHTRIMDNYIERVLNKIGSNILIDSSDNVIIQGNELYRNTICGIWLSRSSNAKIKDNTISSSLYTGIIFERVSKSRVKGNQIISNQHIGILLRESHNNIIEKNNIIRYGEDENGGNNIARRLVYFYNSSDNLWYNNFWDKPHYIRKYIIGKVAEGEAYTIAIQSDSNPAQERFI
jgi:parallel beta-helix repeat protein